MKVKFLSNIEYQTYPVTSDMIDVDEQILNEIGKTKQYKNGVFENYNPKYEEIIQIREIEEWFNTYYTIHEQKYRRLISLNKMTDTGTSPTTELINLYELAEQKRMQLQSIEKILNLE